MKLVEFLDAGAALSPAAPCLVAETATLSYAEVQGLSRSIAASLGACGVDAGDAVGVLSANDPLALTCILGASRADAAWALADPAGASVDELAQELGDCAALLFRASDAEVVRQVSARFSQPHALVCLDGRSDGAVEGALSWGEFLVTGLSRAALLPAVPTVSRPADSDEERPVYLALGPLTEATAARWEPVLAQGGRIVMRTGHAAASPALLEA